MLILALGLGGSEQDFSPIGSPGPSVPLIPFVSSFAGHLLPGLFEQKPTTVPPQTTRYSRSTHTRIPGVHGIGLRCPHNNGIEQICPHLTGGPCSKISITTVKFIFR